MARIDYEITCFDRVISIEVSEQDKEKAAEIIDNAYYEWHELDTDECCEEYIFCKLISNGIDFRDVTDSPIYAYYENGIEELYTFQQVQQLYDDVVDFQTRANNTFYEWLEEMERMQILIKQ